MQSRYFWRALLLHFVDGVDMVLFDLTKRGVWLGGILRS